MKQVIGKWCVNCKGFIPEDIGFCACLMKLQRPSQMEKHKAFYWKEASIEVPRPTMDSANGRKPIKLPRTKFPTGDWAPVE